MASTGSSVREAGIGEVPQLSATLADAFTTEPITQWMFPSDRRRDAHLRRLFGVELEHYVFPAGRVLTTADFRGASLELPPGRWTTTIPLSGAFAYLRASGIRVRRAGRLQVCFERNHLQEPHYYIRRVGDWEGMPAYLEASAERSAALYERLGFVHLGELRVRDGPPFWPMRRPPVVA